MSKKAEKGGLIAVAILAAFGCVMGFIASYVIFAFSGENGYIAGIVLSVIGFAGAIFWIFLIARKRRPEKAAGEKKINRKTVIWIIIAVLSSPAAFGVYMISNVYPEAMWPVIIGVALLAGLFLYSIFVLVSGRTRTKQEDMFTTSSVTEEMSDD